MRKKTGREALIESMRGGLYDRMDFGRRPGRAEKSPVVQRYEKAGVDYNRAQHQIKEKEKVGDGGQDDY